MSKHLPTISYGNAPSPVGPTDERQLLADLSLLLAAPETSIVDNGHLWGRRDKTWTCATCGIVCYQPSEVLMSCEDVRGDSTHRRSYRASWVGR